MFYRFKTAKKYISEKIAVTTVLRWTHDMKHYAPTHLLELTILYPLTKFDAPSQNYFWDIWITKFAKGNNLKNRNSFFFKFHQIIYYDTILYQLTKFEATKLQL